MDPSLVQDQLLDLPVPFIRPGTVFAEIYASLAAGESVYSLASDGVASSLYMPSSLNGWLAVWGEIFGLPKNSGESDFFYATRILNTLTAPVGTPMGIVSWTQFILGTTNVSISENLNQGGYSISIPANLSNSTITNWLANLTRIRPAGIPFSVTTQTNPLMLGSYAYIGGSGFAGAYLGFGIETLGLNLSASTNNSQPLVSEILLTDPLLNGQVSLGFDY
jgi:hypothetical protein